jgi:hypothetical protein
MCYIYDNVVEELLFKDIVAQRSNAEAITKQQAEELKEKEKENIKIGSSNNRHPLHTTQGWGICMMWQDGSTTWYPMIDIQHSFPLHLAEYTMQNKLYDEPAFAWWVKQTLKQHKSFINSMQARYVKRMQKFGIQVP